jgi:hypothetical protein
MSMMQATARRVRVVWGIEAPGGIAETIRRSPAQTRWLIKNKKIRVKRHGPRTYSALEHELIEDCAGGFPEEKEAAEEEPP